MFRRAAPIAFARPALEQGSTNQGPEVYRDSVANLHILAIHGASEAPVVRETLEPGAFPD
jgi:hypothetical protein